MLAAGRFGKTGPTCGSEVGEVHGRVKMGWLTGMVLDLGQWEFGILLWVSGGEQGERRQRALASWLWRAEESKKKKKKSPGAVIGWPKLKEERSDKREEPEKAARYLTGRQLVEPKARFPPIW